MGNCIQSASSGSRGAFSGDEGRLVQRQRSGRIRSSGEEEEGDQGVPSPPSSVVKVKMVLTKAELGWLVSQLKAGDRRLEDVLHEMARKREGRAAGDGCRPSLESIVECPTETTEAAAASSDD